MIDIIKQTPIEYSAQSRDYQVLARLYTAIFNISKMYTDNLSIWNNNIDNRLTTLRAKTLNFNAKHSWPEDDLEAVTSCFKYLIRSKGVLNTIEYCINILMKIQGIYGENLDNQITLNNYIITIRVPGELLTLGILEDLLKYLLPIGYIFNIVKYKAMNLSNLLRTEIAYGDNPLSYNQVPYSEKMYIGTSDQEDQTNIDTRWIDFKKSSKYWLGLNNDDYVPEDQFTEGLESAVLRRSIDKEEPGPHPNPELINISKDDGSETKISIGIPKDAESNTKFITNTFVYTHKDVEEGGEIKYHEEWEEE